jgi:integrase
VEISQRLADAINARRKRLGAKPNDLVFPNGDGNPDHHLLRDLHILAKRAGARFAVELHKLRKTGASRQYLANEPLTTLMLELGHESLATTQRYLADVHKPGEAKKAVPKPKVVKTGTEGDAKD